MNRKKEIKWARFLSGEMSMNEEIAFRKDIQGDPDSINELAIMEKKWKDFEDGASMSEWDTAIAWKKLRNRLDDDGLLLEHPQGKSLHLAPLLRVAAVGLLILAVGTTVFYYGWYSHRATSELQTLYSGQKGSTMDLPDGSRVFLNSESRISYPEDFKDHREVTLKGEAFFEVMSDPLNPFTVRSGKVVVSVLGTSFNVKQVARSQDVEVYVAKGTVRLSKVDSDAFITLEKGEIGSSGKMNQVPDKLNDPNYLSWKTKDFKFVDTELTEVLRELEESYHATIHLVGIEPEGLRITTTYSEQSLEAILETIGTAFGWTVQQRKEGYYLTN